MDLRYGDVDAGTVVEATREVNPALDNLKEIQRRVLGISVEGHEGESCCEI